MKKIEAFQMKKIYAIGNALGIVRTGGGDELHTLVMGLTGKESIKALTYREASAVIARLEELQGRTVSPSREKNRKSRKEHPERPGGVTASQQKKIWALMYELKKYDTEPCGAPLGDRLCAVIKKELHVDAIPKNPFAWLTGSQGNDLIEKLKRYVDSAAKKGEDADGSAGRGRDRKPG